MRIEKKVKRRASVIKTEQCTATGITALYMKLHFKNKRIKQVILTSISICWQIYHDQEDRYQILLLMFKCFSEHVLKKHLFEFNQSCMVIEDDRQNQSVIGGSGLIIQGNKEDIHNNLMVTYDT
jgi:hypothetical protein